MVPQKFAIEIDDYLDKHGDLAKTGKTMKVRLKGTYRDLDVYRIPIKLLRFRLENTRFKVQKIKDEKENGPIDQEKPSGKKRIIELLMYNPTRTDLSKDAKELIADVEKNGQLEPGLITWDGYVLNGNRRLACLDHLNNKKPDTGYEYFIGARLPKGTDEEDYFRIEADLQWAKELKIEYDPLNKYMMLKNATDFKMGSKEIAKLTRKPEKVIKAELEEVKLIEDYLKTTKDPKDFSQVQGQTEVFTEGAKGLMTLQQMRAKPSTITEYKKIFFNFVNVNREKAKTVTYRDIRKLNKVVKRDDKQALARYNKIKSSDQPAVVKKLLTEGAQKFEEHKLREKPDKMAQDLNNLAKKLYSESTIQPISQTSTKLIEATISILKKIINK